ncbi:MAG: hypothetical protein WBC85_07765 [Planktotalea sp.]|uniref:hypothetical protein n=1 Tax=Planktotalea sp. TaxID=2029877 RepID=UPI003C72221F
MRLIASFWKTIVFGATLLGLYYLPIDILGAGEASAPWRKVLAVIDREVLLWVFSVSMFTWLAWTELKPILSERLFVPSWQKPVRGGMPARLRLVGDPASKTLRRVENFNVFRYDLEPGKTGTLLFIVFDKEAGTETIILRNNDASPIRYELLDRTERSVVINIMSPVSLPGIYFECRNDADLMKAPTDVEHLPSEQKGTGIEKQR